MHVAPPSDPWELVGLFVEVGAAVRDGLDGLIDWGRADGHAGQYRHDVVADEIVVPMLTAAGLGVLSEESAGRRLDHQVVAVVDPIDGSTNAARGIPWFATSICAVDDDGPLAAVVVNQALGITYSAVRGGGARRDGEPIAPTACASLGDAIVMLNDLPVERLGWNQYRVLGAAALDLCAVADGTFDAFIDYGVGLAVWDYLGAVLVCREAGAVVAATGGNELVSLDRDHRTGLWAAATSALGDEIVAALGHGEP